MILAMGIWKKGPYIKEEEIERPLRGKKSLNDGRFRAWETGREPEKRMSEY